MKCLVCGLSIDPHIAKHNTGVADCCDSCAIGRRDEYRRLAVSNWIKHVNKLAESKEG